MGVFSSTRISTQPDTGKEGKSQGRGEPRGKIYQKKKKKFLLTNLAGETKREREILSRICFGKFSGSKDLKKRSEVK